MSPFLHLARALDELYEWILEACRHRGEVVGVGSVEVTGKKNKPVPVIPGAWLVRRCERCGNFFGTPEDRIA